MSEMSRRTQALCIEGNPSPIRCQRRVLSRLLVVSAPALPRGIELPTRKPPSIAMSTNFAAQAVIAIENARLLSELRQRTADLSEALAQQTATSEVLSVISSSPGELIAVFDAMLANATRICGAEFGVLSDCPDGSRSGRSAGCADLRRGRCAPSSVLCRAENGWAGLAPPPR
jgi:hypothetical protein